MQIASRFFSLGLGMLLCTLLGLQAGTLVFGKTEDPLLDRIFEESGLSNLGSDPKVLEGLSQDKDVPFEHLYLFMLQNVKTAAEASALEEVAEQTDYSAADLKQILLEDDLAFLQEKKGLKTLDEAFTEWSSLSALYTQEVEFFSLNRQLSIETLAQELFYNGDKQDSAGIDLLSDMSIVHKILFNTPLETPERSGNQVPLLASEEEVVLAAEDSGLFAVPVDEAYSCYDETDIREAVAAYGSVVEENGGSELHDVFVPVIPPDPDLEFEAFLQDVTEGEQSVGVEEFDDLVQTFSAQKGQWGRELPCNDIFCIEINLVTGSIGQSDPDNSYDEKDNCLACHVLFIRERMEDTLSEPLGANKVSAGWFEDATCKEAGKQINLDLNIRAVPKPILQSNNDDSDEKAAQNVASLREGLDSLKALPASPEDIVKSPGAVECEGLINLSNFGASENLEDVFAACQEATEAYDTALAEQYESSLFNVKAQTDSLLISQMAAEFAALRTIFESFQNALDETVEPITSLLNTPYCE